jgi:hypothetical protein
MGCYNWVPFIPCERTKHQLGLIDVHHKYLWNCKICNNAPPNAPYYFITSLQEINSHCRLFLILADPSCIGELFTCILSFVSAFCDMSSWEQEQSPHSPRWHCTDDTIWHCTDKGYAYDRRSWMKKPWASKRSQGPTEREPQIFSNKIIETMGMHIDLPLWWSSALRCSNMWLYMYILAVSQQSGLQNVPSLWNLEIINTPSISRSMKLQRNLHNNN